MNASFAALVQGIAELGSATADELSTLAEKLPAEKREDPQEMLRVLIEQKKVTRFQASLLAKGQGKSLLLGDYLVLDRIGAGGMGQVYRARHRRMDRIVALKIMSSKSLRKP